MKQNSWIWCISFVSFMTISISSTALAGWEENTKISEIFKNAKVSGTFVLYDAQTVTYIGHNKHRAEKRYIPASTFKIPNSLVGLSVGAVKSVDEVLPYKSNVPPLNKAWEKDMGLRDAIVISNVPIYQELARRIGLERMRENVSKMNYGNKEIGDTVDTFWLKGPLEISAIEQTQFLAKLAKSGLPLPQDCQKSVREIILLDKGAGWKLYGKTGWQNAPGQGVGWWVGWVQKGDYVYPFALNMDILKASDANKRVELGTASLKAIGIL
ncbi:MAG: class D beta-lactamase [Desulfobacteraceae bacterium]|nr:class D beta-lactamase [Desulfobacteraceae bacterium]